MIPALGFMAPALILTLALYSSSFARARPALLALLLAVSGVALYGALDPATRGLRHDFLKDNEVARMIADTPEGSPFYIEYTSTDFVVPIAEALQRPIASRFPMLWFMALNRLPEPEREQARIFFGSRMAGDLQSYKPALLFLNAAGDDHTVLSTFGDLPEFQDAMRHYRPAGTITPRDFSILHAGSAVLEPLTFRVYKRRQIP
jgi:hypothetical protein